MTDKPLFIPLKTEHFDAFHDGSKGDELRAYGPRWNEKTCTVGRAVVLSKGYGKRHRMRGVITGFDRKHGQTFGDRYKPAIIDCYGTLDIWIARIGIRLNEANHG